MDAFSSLMLKKNIGMENSKTIILQIFSFVVFLSHKRAFPIPFFFFLAISKFTSQSKIGLQTLEKTAK